MVEPTRRNLDRAVEESMDLFQRARVGEVAPVEPRRPTSALLALDGTSQDATGITIAADCRERFGSAVTVVDARELIESNELAVRVAESFGAQAAPKKPGDSFAQILAAVEQSACDLLITPCPYGRDLDAIGPDSAGTVIDVLLARCPVPILVVRKPCEKPEELFRQVNMILTAENEVAPTAATWASGLIASRGVFQLVLVLEREMHQNIQALLQSLAPGVDISPDALSHALARYYMRLHRSLQKAAAEHGFEYKLKLQLEGEAGSLAIEDESPRSLLALALERTDHASEGGVLSRIRQSPNPVLVVCQERQTK
jgi:hypothetical protein